MTNDDFKMKRHTAVVHDAMGDNSEIVVRSNRVDATLRLEDGRQVQVGILNDGTVLLRAWADDAYLTGNAEALAVSFKMPTLDAMVLGGEQVSNLNIRSHPLTPKSLASPEERDGTYAYCNDEQKERVDALRMLAGLQHGALPA